MDNKELIRIQVMSDITKGNPMGETLANISDVEESLKNRLEALQSQNTYNPECRWAYDENMEMWETGCNTAFHFIEGGFEENSANFCHKCGGKIKAITSKGE